MGSLVMPGENVLASPNRSISDASFEIEALVAGIKVFRPDLRSTDILLEAKQKAETQLHSTVIGELRKIRDKASRDWVGS